MLIGYTNVRTLLCALVLAVWPLSVQAAEGVGRGGFLSEIEDLPLPAGLTETAGSGTTFDTPAGRIVEVYAEGQVEAPRVRQFYEETLPSLGWTVGDRSTFRREGERLRIEILTEHPKLTVRFTIAPE
ncbi:MAG: hypothetical protein ABT940_07490 [Alphaproteobacteria bacterium]